MKVLASRPLAAEGINCGSQQALTMQNIVDFLPLLCIKKKHIIVYNKK